MKLTPRTSSNRAPTEKTRENDRVRARTPKRKFDKARDRSKRRGLTWTLSFEAYSEVVADGCTYCGGALPITGHGLDRIDNSQGYHFDNVLSCCAHCNYLRGGRLTVHETEILVRNLYELRGAERGKLWEK